MALAYQSVQVAEVSSGTSIVVTKPVGLAVGDLMVAHLGYGLGVAGTLTLNAFASFTLFTSVGNPTAASGVKTLIYYKIADAGDVAAANFTFTTAETLSGTVAISRWTGHDATTPLSISSTASSNSASSLAPTTITPVNGNSMIYIAGQNRENLPSGSYSIATDNPTWTEIYDNEAGSTGFYTAGAYAYRPESTATGAGNITMASAGVMAAIMFFINVSPSTSTTTETITVSDTFTSGVAVTTTESLTLSDSETADKAYLWNNTAKSSSTWINEDK